MTASPFIRQFLAFAFVLTSAGVASARRPPSLANIQERTDRVVATCPSAPATSGYRDMLTRFDSNDAPRSAVFVARRRMLDHIAIKCAGGEVMEGGGYRDMLVRFFHDSAGPQIARAGTRQVR